MQWVLDYLKGLQNVTAIMVSTHKQLLSQVHLSACACGGEIDSILQRKMPAAQSVPLAHSVVIRACALPSLPGCHPRNSD